MISEDDLQKLDLATDAFERVLSDEDLIGTQLSRCPGWSTRDVANHVLGGAIRYTHYFSGGDPAEIAWTRTADHVAATRPGPIERLPTHFAANSSTIATTASSCTIRSRTSTRQLLVMRVQELVLHSWDIASVAEPDIELDPSLCRFLLDRGETVRTILRTAGALGHATTPVSGRLTAEVLAEWGRG